jgi:phosphatidylinositol alpha-mannosyltransferase
MKIAFVLDDTLDKTDGVQQYVLTLGKWYRNQGHVVHYLVADTERTDIPNVHSLGRFVNVNFNQNNVRTPLPASRRKIKQLLEREKYDVYHVQLPYSPFLAKQIVRYAADDAAVIGTFHILPASMLHGLTNKGLRVLLGRSVSRFDGIVAVSEPAVHFARSAYGLRAQFLPNVIDTANFRSGKPLGRFNKRKLNIVFLGRLVKRKGILELIKAYNGLSEESAAKTRLIICGKGPLRSKAKSMVRRGRNVSFEGFVSEADKPNYLASADIAVFPSLGGESFGIVLIEAMAAGSGVVLGGNNAGYKSVLGSQPYLLFDPKSEAQFIEHLELFITDEKLRTKMHAWQEESFAQYDVGVVGRKLLEIYDEALRGRRNK